MPPISHLQRARCATARGARVHSVAIAANDPASRVVSHPRHERVRKGVFQQINNPMSLCVHQDRAVAAAAAQCELIDSKDTWRDNRSIWDCPDQAQQRGPARRHGQARAVATAGPTTKRKPNRLQYRPEPLGAMRVAVCENCCLLDECPARTLRLTTAEPSNLQVDDRPATGDGQVAETACVTAMNRVGVGPTPWTTRARHVAPDRQMHDLTAQCRLLENEPGTRQQHLRTHRPPSGWPSELPGRRVLPAQSGQVQPALTCAPAVDGCSMSQPHGQRTVRSTWPSRRSSRSNAPALYRVALLNLH